MSLICLKKISIERDISKTSEKHLKRDNFFERSLRRLSSDVSDMSEKYIPWKYLWLFNNITQKWFRADKIDVWALKTLKEMKCCFLGAMHSHYLICHVGSCLHVVYFSSMAYKSFGSFGMSRIVKSEEQVYYLLLLVTFLNDKTL